MTVCPGCGRCHQCGRPAPTQPYYPWLKPWTIPIPQPPFYPSGPIWTSSVIVGDVPPGQPGSITVTNNTGSTL